MAEQGGISIPPDALICTEELFKRPARAPDYQRENCALVALVQAMADSPNTVLQKLSDVILDVCKAGSSGISILSKDGTRFFWPVISGAWKEHAGGGTPRNFSPCGEVLDCNAPLLMADPALRYDYLRAIVPSALECMLVPFSVEGKTVGTIWAINHDSTQKFDAEDLRMLMSLSRFTSAAWQATEHATKTVSINEALLIGSLRQHELTAEAENLNAMMRIEIIEHKQARNALRASELRFRTLFELVPVAVYSCDALGVIQNFNIHVAELWGRTPAPGDTDEIFCGSYKLLRPDGSFMPYDQCPMAEVLSGHIAEVRDAEMIIERPDGSRATVVVNIHPLKNERGEITGAINCFYNITERKKVEEKTKQLSKELAATDRSKDEFLAMLAHELRNPLTPIKSAAEILRLSNVQDPVILKVQKIIERQANQLTRLVDDLLDSSRIQNRKVTLHFQSVELTSALLAVIDGLSDSVELNHHIITLELEKSSPLYIQADPARLAQIFTNLIVNAIKYTPSGGAIRVTTAREGGNVVIRVHDNGIGLEKHMLESIFDLFTQVEVSMERSKGGLGLGLRLVRELVEMQSGTVKATSEGKGKGSEFTVSFPEIRHVAAEPAILESAAGRSRRVLLIDDNIDILEAMNLLLTLSGHTVETAETGPQGLEKAMHGNFDVALVDIGLPEMNGYDVAKRIRENPGTARMPLIALTGYGQDHDKRRTLESGFNEHLTKPVDPKVLIDILNKLELYYAA